MNYRLITPIFLSLLLVAGTVSAYTLGNVTQNLRISANRGETYIQWSWKAANASYVIPPVNIYIDDNTTPSALNVTARSYMFAGLTPKTPHYITLENGTAAGLGEEDIIGRATVSTLQPATTVYFLLTLVVLMMVIVLFMQDVLRLFLVSFLTIAIAIFGLMNADGYGATGYMFYGVIIVTAIILVVNGMPRLREQIDWF
jgi:hypothetical protein